MTEELSSIVGILLTGLLFAVRQRLEALLSRQALAHKYDHRETGYGILDKYERGLCVGGASVNLDRHSTYK